MPTPPMPALDPIVEAQIARSLARYAGLVTPEMMATLREVLEDALTTHPVALKLVDSLRERAVPEASGAVPKAGSVGGQGGQGGQGGEGSEGSEGGEGGEGSEGSEGGSVWREACAGGDQGAR